MSDAARLLEDKRDNGPRGTAALRDCAATMIAIIYGATREGISAAICAGPYKWSRNIVEHRVGCRDALQKTQCGNQHPIIFKASFQDLFAHALCAAMTILCVQANFRIACSSRRCVGSRH